MSEWLNARSGELVTAPTELGTTRLPVLADAPGIYVLDK